MNSAIILGHSATLHSHASLHPHFASPGLATQALIRAGKTSYTLNVMRHYFSGIVNISSKNHINTEEKEKYLKSKNIVKKNISKEMNIKKKAKRKRRNTI